MAMAPTADSPLLVTRTNTILYCNAWADTVAFYRDIIGLTSKFVNDWFVEFELGGGAHLSVADTAHTSIPTGGGAGLTLSWEVTDLEAACQHLIDQSVVVTEPTHRWGATTVFLHDPEGNRIELWIARQEVEG